MRVAAVGRTRWMLDAVAILRARGHTVPLVATCAAAPEYGVAERDFEQAADLAGAAFYCGPSLNTPYALAVLRDARADVAISVNWLTVIGAEAIAAFPLGILNAHAGDLPRYRGNAPVAWALLQGEEHVGVCAHLMTPGELDSGPVVRRERIPLTNTTYIGDVFRELSRLMPLLLVEAAEGLGSGALTPIPQAGPPLRCYPRRPEDGRLVWTQPADHLARLVRASAEPFAGAFCEYHGARLIVWRAHAEPWVTDVLAMPGQVVAREPDGAVRIATGDGSLVITEVTGDAHRCTPGTIIRSTRARLT